MKLCADAVSALHKTPHSVFHMQFDSEFDSSIDELYQMQVQV